MSNARKLQTPESKESVERSIRTMPLTGPALSRAEAQRVQRYQERLLRAIETRDRAALHSAKQDVLQVAYQPPSGVTPALRQALRMLSWHMAGMLLPRTREW